MDSVWIVMMGNTLSNETGNVKVVFEDEEEAREWVGVYLENIGDNLGSIWDDKVLYGVTFWLSDGHWMKIQSHEVERKSKNIKG